MKLSEAIAANDPQEVRKALKRVKNINNELRDVYCKPLTYAAKRNAHLVVEPLIEAGAAPGLKEPGHPLKVAAEEGNTAVLTALLTARGWEPEPLANAIFFAALQGQVDSLATLFEQTKVRPGAAALKAASMAGRTPAVRLLLAAGADPAELDDKTTAIHTAARSGYPDILAEFLARGVDVNLPDANGRTPLMHAVLEHVGQRFERVNLRQKKRDLANPNSGVRMLSGSLVETPYARRTIKTLLAAGADPAARDHAGWTAMDILSQERKRIDPWLKQTMEAAGAPPVDDWPIAVVEAISKQDYADLEVLLSRERDVNFTTARRISPLTQACRKGDATLVQRLLAAGADPNRIGGNETPLAAAVVGKSLDVTRSLLDAGADPNQTVAGDREQETPLRLAKDLRYRELADLIAERGGRLDGSDQQARIEPGIHWWDDWEFVVVRAEPAAVAAALDPAGKATELAALGKTFVSHGKNTLILVQPEGLAWTNVMQASPLRDSDGERREFALQLAVKCGAPTVYAAYSDTGVAAAFSRFDPDGACTQENSHDLKDAEWATDFGEDTGPDAPAWAVELIQRIEAGEDPPPDSLDQLEALAKSEGFAWGWGVIAVDEGKQFDVEFLDYKPSAIRSAVVVEAT